MSVHELGIEELGAPLWRESSPMRGLRFLRKTFQALHEVVGVFCWGWTAISLVTLPLAGVDHAGEEAAQISPAGQPDWNAPLSDNERILQLLNRITFGPRPGDVERVRAMGIDAFLNQQLHPEGLNDSVVEAKIAKLPTLQMSKGELAEDFQRMSGERRAQKRGGKDAASSAASEKLRGAAAEDSADFARRAKDSPRARDLAEAPGPRRVIMELAQEEVLRAVYGDRQLQEVMAQFWTNHFNIFAPKGADRWLTTSFERDTIRPRALGKFEDLLVATAKSPAMLFYLDNWMSATPNPTYHGNSSGRRGRFAPGGAFSGRSWRPFGWGRSPGWRRFGDTPTNRPAERGLNENYGRELMELHTLGVNGGYTQKDVIEVARCLSGWTIERPKRGGEFVFDPRRHDFGTKIVLGHKIKSGRGMEDGLEVLHLLAHHPSTAHFISLKLCRRFVADEPPESVVERARQTFLKSDGDIRAVLKTILTSPEFYSRAAYRAKMKSPLELVASSVRGLGADTDASVPLVEMLARMGQPLFQYQAPTGFPDRAGTWINSGALLMRMNFATLLASNRIRGTAVDWKGLAPAPLSSSPAAILAKLDQQLLAGTLSAKTRVAILQQSPAAGRPDHGGMPPESLETVVALVLASPEFQRR